MINLIPKLRGVFVYIRAHLVVPPITLDFNLLVQRSPRLHTSKCLFNRRSAPRTASAECYCERGSQCQIEGCGSFPLGKEAPLLLLSENGISAFIHGHADVFFKERENPKHVP